MSESLPTTDATAHDLGVVPGRARARVRAVPRTRKRRGWLVRRLLATSDVLMLLASFAVIEALFRDATAGIDRVGIDSEVTVYLVTLPLWILGAKLYGLYDRDEERPVHSTVDEFLSVFHLVTVAVWVFYAFSWITGLTSPDQRKLASFWALSIVTMTLGRTAVRAIARRHPWYRQKTVVVGAGAVGQLVARKLLQHPEYGLDLVGFVDADPREVRADIGDVPLLGPLSGLAEVVERGGVERVVIAFSRDKHEQMLDIVRSIRHHQVQIDVVPRLFDVVNAQVSLHTIEGLPLLGLTPAKMPRSSRLLKRSFDFVAASILLTLTAPLIALIALLIRLDSPGGALFRQTRLGMDAREFTLLKFRTMREGTDEAPHREYIRNIMDAGAEPGAKSLYKLPRTDSVTRVGRLLRKTSLDELPQLFNVLRDDMSLVGPRPCIPYELEFFQPHHYERFLVPAGITGLWQVEARAHVTFAEALDLDVAYAHGWSFGLDLRLLMKTPLLMLRKQETS